MEFSLANLDTTDGERAALALGSGYYRLDRLAEGVFACGLRTILNDWGTAYPKLVRMADGCADLGSATPAFLSAEIAVLTSPIKYPNKLICVGGVYRDHMREFGLPAERSARMPIFLRSPTTSIVGPGRTVKIPPTTKQFDWEIELALVIGAFLTDADIESARHGIAGYSVGIDLTCRDLLNRNAPTGVDLVRAKAQDGMAPIGPVLRPSEFVGDPQNLGLRLYVNDELKQNGSTADMLYSVYEQVATISHYITLEPGDIVFTGSPAGSGASIQQFLKPGDRIRAEIDRVGCLEVEIVPTTRNLSKHPEIAKV